MYPFQGAIGRFRIHSAQILPGRRHFCVEGLGIIHSARILPGLFASRSTESCIGRESCRGVFVPRVLESCMGLRSCQRSALCGSLRSSGQKKSPFCARRGYVHAACPCSASASLDMKKAPEGAFFICYAICGVRRRQAGFLQLIAARSQQKGAKGPVSRRLGEKSVEGHSLLAA